MFEAWAGDEEEEGYEQHDSPTACTDDDCSHAWLAVKEVYAVMLNLQNQLGNLDSRGRTQKSHNYLLYARAYASSLKVRKGLAPFLNDAPSTLTFSGPKQMFKAAITECKTILSLVLTVELAQYM